jgi:tRNA dimethylallyltransferase
MALDEAARRGKLDTRHYAKRQFTFFRHQLPEFRWVAPQQAQALVMDCLAAPAG